MLSKHTTPKNPILLFAVIFAVTTFLGLLFLIAIGVQTWLSSSVNTLNQVGKDINPNQSITTNQTSALRSSSDQISPTTSITEISLSNPNIITPASQFDLLPTQSQDDIKKLQQENDPWVDERLSVMTIEQKIGQMLMIGVDGKSITPPICDTVADLSPGGIVYRGANVESPEQLRDFSAGLHECSSKADGIPLLISIDHEGQYVNRFESGITIFPSAMAQGGTGDPNYAYQAAYTSGIELNYSGVNMVLGPVADVLTDYDNTVMRVIYSGPKPLNFEHAIQVVALGKYDSPSDSFKADKILTKCPSKYIKENRE